MKMYFVDKNDEVLTEVDMKDFKEYYMEIKAKTKNEKLIEEAVF